MEKRLFVGNLPYSVDETQLEAAFAEHGTVVSAVVIRDRESGRSRGFGFVEMETEEMAENAVEAGNYQVALNAYEKLGDKSNAASVRRKMRQQAFVARMPGFLKISSK